MLRDLNKIRNCVVEGLDGTIGTVADLYFNDQTWKVHYVAADTGNWLQGRHVLISRESLLGPKWETASFPALVKKSQVEQAPKFEIEKPLSWQKEREICQYYQWSTYFPVDEEELTVFPGLLTSANGLKDFSLMAVDGEIGKIINFLVEDTDWIVRYIVVDTSKWLAGKQVLISPMWNKSIEWPERKIVVDLSQEQIKNSPEYDPTAPIERVYEINLYRHYGKPHYW
ncbi:MAG: PRC-barrel domain-containing protein [Nitrospirales bacterium]|nr:PRC-barrel domain-containing protein [Nitrospirales bacterium]